MAIVQVNTVWGNAEIREELPTLEILNRAVYVPFNQSIFFDRDSRWGIYREDKTLFELAAYTRGDPRTLVGQSWEALGGWCDLDEAPPIDYIYGGPLIPHYGHFLLTSLSRLWPVMTGNRGRAKILFHAYGDPQDWFKTPYVRDTLGALGLSPDDCIVFNKTVRIRSLVVPAAGFKESQAAHRIYIDLCHKIGRTILPHDKPVSGGKPIYLSKVMLSGGVGHLSNESAFLMKLQQRMGIDIIFPERLTMMEQISIFKSKRLIIGTTSSAFHTSLFSESNPELVCLCLRPFLSSNFIMIDELNNNVSTYITSDHGFIRHEGVDGFLETFEARSPSDFADEVFEFLQDQILDVV